MKNLFAFLLISAVAASCSPTPQSNQITNPQVNETATPQPTLPSQNMAVTVKPPAIPIGPIEGNPAFPVATPTPFTIGGWQTYSDTRLGIAVQYPPDWTVTEQGDGAIFTSAQGIQISLQSSDTTNESNGTASASRDCTTLINSYVLTINTCFDAAAYQYSAEYKIKSAGGSIQTVILSTTDKQALDVYRKMLNTLKVAQ
jgi:hypothetical protein